MRMTHVMTGVLLAAFATGATTEPMPIMLDGVSSDLRAPAWSPDGGRIAFETLTDGNWVVSILDLADKSIQRISERDVEERFPAWSPDGSSLAVVCGKPADRQICIRELATGKLSRLTESGGDKLWPSWSPDGQQIAYSQQRGEDFGIWIVAIRTPLAPVFVADGKWPRWSPDGKQLAYFSRPEQEESDDEIYTIQLDSGESTRLTHGSGHDFCPGWSPHGDALVVVSIESPDARALRVLDVRGIERGRLGAGFFRVTEPAWSPDGAAIAYVAALGEGQPYLLHIESVDGLALMP